MLNISKLITNFSSKNLNKKVNKETVTSSIISKKEQIENVKKISVENLKAYIPSFCADTQKTLPSDREQLRFLEKKLDKDSKFLLDKLDERGILADNRSNDGSTVLNNLYKIASEPRITGLSDTQIISEVLKALYNPSSITQKFGDIPNNVVAEIEQETGTPFPQQAKDVESSTCVVASMEFNLASKNPAEFVRFAEGLSGKNYSIDKNIKLNLFSGSFLSKLYRLREFNTDYEVKNWEDVSIKIKPDRNAIIRARVQSSYKNPDERSCVDVLIQSALLNLGSQHTYDSITDEREITKFNNDLNGLTDFEKTFVEEVVFEKPKISLLCQKINDNGFLVGYNYNIDEIKQHILKSLELGQNVIVGRTEFTPENQICGAHEITIIDYEKDANGNGFFIYNDTADDLDTPLKCREEKLLPLIHHAGISKDVLNSKDVIL